MQRRRAERISLDLPARIELAGKSYEGTIINVSEDGVGSAITSEIDVHAHFMPANNIALYFQAHAGEEMQLMCELAWFSRNSIDVRKITIGMRVINPSPRYKDFIQGLYDASLKDKTREQLIADLLRTRERISRLETGESSLSQSGFADIGLGGVYEALVESTDESIYVVDRECRYQFMNQKHLARLGVSGNAYRGRPYSDFHSDEESDEFREKVEEVFRTGEALRYELGSGNEGKHFLRTISPIRGDDGNIQAVTVISKNITDRKLTELLLLNANQELDRLVRERADDLLLLNENLTREIAERKQTEGALKKASDDWRATFDATRDLMIMMDEHFTIKKANKATSAYLGKSFGQIVGHGFFEFFDGMDIQPDRHPLEKTKRSGRHEEAEIYNKSRDMWVLVSADPIAGDAQAITGAVVIMRDITEQKSLQMQLLQAQKMDSIGRLAGGVAHDFNNLLSSIIGYTELSLLKLPADSPLKDHLLTVKLSAEKAAALTHRLLAFSRKQMLQMQAVDLNAVIESMVKMMSRMIREDISLELQTGSSVRKVMADPVQVEQIIMNLLVNARDAMPHGGKLIITSADVDLDEDFVIRHENVKPGPYVLLSVSDTGIGMTRQTQERIFEPFFTTKSAGEGTGLGLATVYGIVKQHNGYIYVYSELGKGTTFKIYLPVAEVGQAATVVKERVSLVGGTETVLVVDDDPSIRKLIKDVLQPLGYRLFFAHHGESALNVAREAAEPIHVLLTDVVMPVMNGKQLAELFHREYPDVKIIFMSGYMDETITREGDLTSGSLLIQKPLSPGKLATALREVIERAGS